MFKDKMNILIIGAGKGGTALIETLSRFKSINIIGISDINSNAPGMKLAKELGIPTSNNWKDFVDKSDLGEILDLTGNNGFYEVLTRETPKNVNVIKGSSAKMLWLLLKEQGKIEKELKDSRDELVIQEWGLAKTNEAIKVLYKELEEKNKKLSELDKLKSDFISIVSHELRTPLAIIKEGISLIIDGIPGNINDKQKNVLLVSRGNIDRLTRIINDLLDISKIEAGKTELNKVHVNINALLKSFLSSFKLKFKDKGLELKVSLPDSRIDIYVDPDKITQVFTNLIYNAIKFTKEGFVEVALIDKEGEVECSVSDTGIGISEQDLPKLFSKFQQFGRTPGAGEKGTGLGLSIAKSIVELHKGRIWVESRVGHGTKFSFTLPKVSEYDTLKEHLSGRIKKAINNNWKIALLSISLVDFDKMNPGFSLEAALKDMESLLKNSLRRNTDIYVFEDVEKIAVVLIDCGKEGCSKVEKRIREILDAYLSYENLSDKVKLRINHAIYPDEADNEEKLIKKVM